MEEDKKLVLNSIVGLKIRRQGTGVSGWNLVGRRCEKEEDARENKEFSCYLFRS